MAKPPWVHGRGFIQEELATSVTKGRRMANAEPRRLLSICRSRRVAQTSSLTTAKSGIVLLFLQSALWIKYYSQGAAVTWYKVW